jgi:hypothetical protein
VTVLWKRFTRVCRSVMARTAFCLLSISCAVQLQADDASTEFWPEWDVYLRLNDESRLFFLYSATKLDNRQTYSDGSFGGHFDVYAVPLLRRRVCVKIMRTSPGASRSWSGGRLPLFPHSLRKLRPVFGTHSNRRKSLAFSAAGVRAADGSRGLPHKGRQLPAPLPEPAQVGTDLSGRPPGCYALRPTPRRFTTGGLTSFTASATRGGRGELRTAHCL